MPSLTLPARFEVLDEIRDLVARTAADGGFSEKSIYSLQLAADEAASNVIEHAYEGVTDGLLELDCEMRGDVFVIRLRDHGTPFDPSSIKQPDIHADLSDRPIGGLGVYLMRKLMDEVIYQSDPSSGNLLTMTKRRE